ncbi:MAG: hypothetical protein JNJ99_02540 [Crocinitomicaceae bacterium]|nr:hypothetical protein [Crocinitomicaceae bacterium]
MKKFYLVLFLTISAAESLFCQKKPEDFGYRHMQIEYQNLTTEILIASKKGEEQIAKPILFFCQGSLPTPLLITEGDAAYSVFPFSTDIFTQKFHLVIAGKPGIPLIIEASKLNPDFTYTYSTGLPPLNFQNNDILDYYTSRNNFILKNLVKENWVDNKMIVVAGHSAGATIAVEMAATNKKITHLIYASGNPFGRIVSMIEKSKSIESDSSNYKENDFGYWNYLNTTPFDELSPSEKSDFTFSEPSFDDLKKIRIPVIFSYGSKDFCAPYLDYVRIWAVQNNATNFEFREYKNLDHNFFKVNADGSIDYENFNWDQVAEHWLSWLN